MFSFVKIVLKSYILNKWSILFFDGLWVLGLNEVENNREEDDGIFVNFEWKVLKCGRLLDDVLLFGFDGRVWDFDVKLVVLFKFKVILIFKVFCLCFLVVGGVVVFVGVGIGMCFIGLFWVVVMVRKVFIRIVIFFIVCKKFCGSVFK